MALRDDERCEYSGDLGRVYSEALSDGSRAYSVHIPQDDAPDVILDCLDQERAIELCVAVDTCTG